MRAVLLAILLVPLAAALPPAPSSHDVAYVGPSPREFGHFLGENDFACHGDYAPLFGHGYPGPCLGDWDGSIGVEIVDAGGLPVAGYVALVADDHRLDGFTPFCGATRVVADSSFFLHVRVYPAGAAESVEHCAGAFTVGATAGVVRFTDV